MPPAPPLIAIFGAAVWADGRPSPSLRRRIAFGYAAAQAHPQAKVFCSGGLGRHGPSEAAVMARELIRSGLPADRVVLDEASLDTLQSARAVAHAARRLGVSRIVVCSDRYHLPRIRLLLAAMGIASEAGPCAGRPKFAHWIGMSLREAVAIPYDLAIVLFRRPPPAS